MENKNTEITLEMVKPKDRVDGYPVNTPFLLRKFLEIFPGLLTWFFILSPMIFALIGLPQVLVVYVAFLTIYWAFRGLRFVYGLFEGYRRIQRDISTDWMQKIKELKDPRFNELNYVLICPVYKEGLETLRPTMEAWKNSDIGPKKISIVFALEESAESINMPNYKIIEKEYKNYFREFMYYQHPKNIAGEIVGVKGANINWATRNYVKLLQKRGEDISKMIVISCDSDLRPHPKYLSAIMYKYLTVQKPEQKFFATAVHTYNNNLWRVPSLIRIQSAGLTLVLLHGWVTTRRNTETFSSYVVNLQTVHNCGYWPPDLANDDTYFSWNALIRYDGDFEGVEVYVPTYNDAVENKDYIETHKSLYKQQLRWGWGIVTFPVTVAALLANKKIAISRKISVLWTLLENRLLYLTLVYIMTFALPLMNIFSDQFQYSSASYNLPKLMSYILTSLLLLNIPLIYYKRKISPPPGGWNIFRQIWDFFETFLTLINMLSFSFIPYLQAQTEMMFGKGARKKFYITDKNQIK